MSFDISIIVLCAYALTNLLNITYFQRIYLL